MKSALLILCISLLSVFSLKAQTHQLEFGYGMSLKSGIIKTALNLKKDVNVEGTAVIIAGYEYRIVEMFALGLGFTHQSLNGDYTFETEVQNVVVDEKLSFDFKRYAIVLEPKFYYPINSDVLELYTSVRLGYKREKLDANTTNNNINEILKLTDLIAGRGVNASITPLGVNYFPIKNVGIGLAGNLGPTYWTKASVFLRF
ncbi:MAG: hypothetical protein JXR19_06530 [Bacteroidia bacterium]